MIVSRRKKLEVLYCDNHLLVVVKPSGMPTVPDASRDESLLERAKQWVKQEYSKPGDVFLGVVQRLDRPVSGVICFARTSKAATRLTAALREGRMKKTYLAVTSPPPPEEKGSVQHFLLKDREQNLVEVVGADVEGAKLARTEYSVRGVRGDRALVELSPITGRPHQLRVAMASLGSPLVGDVKYGAQGPLADRSIALHSTVLDIPHPTRDEVLTAEYEPEGEVWQL